MPPYKHTPLHQAPDPSDVTIRLLDLPPGDKTGLISCHLFTTPLSQAPEYEAVSYCWGVERGVIFIDTNPAPFPDASDAPTPSQPPASQDILPTWHPLVVPASLISFLYRTRAKNGQTRTLWVDSICIDQTNIAERDAQVPHMRDIYMRAKRTLIWLGPAADRSEEALQYAFDLTQKLRHEIAQPGEALVLPPSAKAVSQTRIEVGHPGLAALIKVLDRPYFERAWIVQEVVVSQEAHVIIGDNSLHWLWFLGGFLHLMDKHAWVFEFYPGHRLGLLMELRVSGKEWEDKVDGEWFRLLSRHRSVKAGDARDKVFAFWGLTSKEEFEQMGVMPEYGISVAQVYWKLAAAALRRGHVEVLSVPRIVLEEFDDDIGDPDVESSQPHGFGALDMPSWVPDWRYTDRTPESLLRFELPGNNWRPPYAASSNSSFPEPFDTSSDDSMYPKELRLKGFSIARITQLNPRPWKINMLSGNPTFYNQARTIRFNQRQIVDWEKIIRLPGASRTVYHPTGETVLEACYKTITAGLYLHGSVSLTKKAIDAFESRQRILRFFVFLGIQNWLWPYVVVVAIAHFLRFLGVENPEWKFRMLVPAMTNRKAARLIAEDGKTMFLGLVPGLSRVGDVAVLCAGVKVPLVLRKREGFDGGERWELVGDAYVHGVMNGERWVDDRTQWEIFHVV
ncbi:uncharacterized protein EI97DRAFT_429246 [Westerdykella ornata]|uniref:Heterokaryon incompatibility domain-containing protein n=1 Tax=Westerdykella ornata TaxID=318751 RepID=A0A6A6JY89_WESOR|nr:uncharacterized protein EI97DRAFT_429246 [Westerdykella ornata]KAF2281184.1 hypothetical protein EI97DRAFT_429246 [Westerdykella ornata]